MALRTMVERVGNVCGSEASTATPEIAERALSREAAAAKAQRIAAMIERGEYNPLRRRQR